MNRRGFLMALGTAALGAAALEVLDPEKLLWVPGAKTIIDLGATKHLEPATDGEVARLFATQQGFTEFDRIASEARANRNIADWERRELERVQAEADYSRRNITLTLGGQRFGGDPVTYHYKGDKLVSRHSEAELRRLEAPLTPLTRRILGRDRFAPASETDFSLIDVPEDRE